MTMDHARNYTNLSCIALQIPYQNGILRHTLLAYTSQQIHAQEVFRAPFQPSVKQHQRHYKVVRCCWSTWELYIIYMQCILYPIIGRMWLSCSFASYDLWQIFLTQAASAERERRARTTEVRSSEAVVTAMAGWSKIQKVIYRHTTLNWPYCNVVWRCNTCLFSGYWIETYNERILG